MGNRKGTFRRKISDRQIGAALLKHQGKIGLVAQELDVTTATIRKRIKENPRVMAKFEDSQELLVDKAMGVVEERLDGGDGKMAQYVLDNMGGNRGFGRKQKEKVDDGATSNMTFNILDTSEMTTEQKKLMLEGLKKAQEKQLEEGKNS